MPALATNTGATVHVKLFEDVTNQHDLKEHMHGTKAPPPTANLLSREAAVSIRQQRQAQVALQQRTNATVPRYAQPCGRSRPQTAPCQRHLTKGPAGDYAAALSRPPQRGDYAARTAAAERAYLAPSKALSADPYALPYKAPGHTAGHNNPRLGEVEKDLLHRQAMLRRLMRDPRHAAHGLQPSFPASRPPSTASSLMSGCVGSPEMYRHEKARASLHARASRASPSGSHPAKGIRAAVHAFSRCWARAHLGWCHSCAPC